MTSRPGPGIHETLQSRGSTLPPRIQVRRRPSKPTNLAQADCIDPALDERPQAYNPPAEPTRPPPRGQPQLFYTTVASNGFELPIHPSPYQPTANLPAPPRPGSVNRRDAAQQRRIMPGGTGVKDPPKLTAPEAVSPPVHFPGGKPADLFPWTGDSAEDAMSEALVKNGINNKAQIMNETNTARPSLWSNLKNKSGISTLSSLFVAVLEKRQQSGRLQAPNTFKPPPRLTLRDSTREQWLHDLANPTIGLRRLSRTIPHGLTGKVLLEQCLNKNIPLPRALWLAKCVGINELRAHKRKGQAGTVTWGRGWTSSVEQFVEGVIGTIAQGDWKSRITYALQLATHLYTEHLLDEDHFLDWIVNGLDTCPSERLFVWLLVISISHYWKDITCCRRRGKCLAESLLNQLEKIYRLEDYTPYAAVLQYLETTLVKLLATRPPCLLLPASWIRRGAILQTLAERRKHPQLTLAIKKLDHRNNRLLQSPKNVTLASHTPAGRVYRILDSVKYHSTLRIEDLSRECIEAVTGGPQLVPILLQWACSCYRDGAHRIYLVTRLLRRRCHLGEDVYEGIVAYLRDMSWVETGEPSNVFKIIAELVRSKTFSAGRYLQWLIATGSLGHDTDLSSPESWPMRLITEIPLSGLSDQIRTLRSTLLRGTAHSIELEERNLEQAERVISQTLPTLFGLYSPNEPLPEIDLTQLSPTIKLELGTRLRQYVSQYMEINEHVPTKDLNIAETATVSSLTCKEFHVVRSYLEQFEDLAILADVVGIAASTLDPLVLASIADTLNFHRMAFRAIGAFDPLFGKIALRYAAIRTIRFPDREMLYSLSNLGRAARADGQLQQLLSYDLSRLDQKNSIAACSPASDNMGEVVLMGASSDEEIERILSSGTSMDEHMMARVLRKIISNLGEYAAKGPLHFDTYPTWFHRLRSFDESTFDMVVREWATSQLVAHHVEALQAVLPILIGSGCWAMTTFLEICRTCVTKLKNSPSGRGFQTALHALQILLPSDDLSKACSPQDGYRHRLEQHKLYLESGSHIILCIRDVVEFAANIPSPNIHNQLSCFLSSNAVLTVTKHCLVSDPGCVSSLCRAPTGFYVRPLFSTLLDPNFRLRLSEQNPEQQVLSVFSVASELSLPICQVVIEQIFSSDSALSGDSADILSAALLNAINMAVEKGQSAGLELIATLDATVTNKIRQHAEREIINASAFFTTSTAIKSENHKHFSAAFVEKYLTIMNLTSSKTKVATDYSAMLVALIERFKGIAQSLSDQGSVGKNFGQANSQSILEIYAWLNALLRLAVTHCSTMLRNASHQHQVALMVALKSLFVHPTLETYPSVSEHVFDVAVFLSDHVFDDVRIHVARLDTVRLTDDPRCLFVLGVTSPVDGWLVLTKPVAHPMSQPPTPGISKSPTLPPPGGSQMPAAGSPASQQRPFNPQHQRQNSLPGQQQQQHMRTHPQFSQQPAQQSKMLPAQLQRIPSSQASPTQLQQMQQMQQMQGLAQQRATQPSPIYTQRPTPAAGSGAATGAAPIKLIKHEKEMKQYPFVQPRWEILAESSGNPNGNDTAISLTLFGARKV